MKLRWLVITMSAAIFANIGISALHNGITDIKSCNQKIVDQDHFGSYESVKKNLFDTPDTQLNDTNFPDHYPVSSELNYFLWYGIIPYIKLLALDFYDYDSSFGQPKDFVSSVLSGIQSLGSSNTSTGDKKNQYPINISKQPFQISQRFQKDKPSTPRNFGPDSTNDDTSWVISAQATVTAGNAYIFNIPGFSSSISDGETTTLTDVQTTAYQNVINYDEHVLARDLFLVLCQQFQSKSAGSTDKKEVNSYWKNLGEDLVYSQGKGSVQLFNPFAKGSSALQSPIIFSSFVDQFVKNIVKKKDATSLKLQWGDDTDSDINKSHIFNFAAGKSLNLIDHDATNKDDSTRWQVNIKTPVESKTNDKGYKYNLPGMQKYKIDSNETSINTFNYFFEQAFLGITLYGGILPSWFQGNASLTHDTSNVVYTDRLYDQYFKANYINGNSGSSLFDQWKNNSVNASGLPDYDELMTKKLTEFNNFAFNQLKSELWLNNNPDTLIIQKTNKIVKPLEFVVSETILSKTLKTISDSLVDYQDTKLDYNYDAENHDIMIDYLNNYNNVLSKVAKYEALKVTPQTTATVLLVILGFVVAAFLIWIIYIEYILKYLRKKNQNAEAAISSK